MDLPTYTNIWRIEKRLYKLYDFNLPVPLPMVTIGVFIGVFLPWVIFLRLVQVPFSSPWHVLYIVPPGLVTYLATRPVLEGKRLTELLLAQLRYLIEPRTWCRLTPVYEPERAKVTAVVWRRISHPPTSPTRHAAGRARAPDVETPRSIDRVPSLLADHPDPVPVRPAIAPPSTSPGPRPEADSPPAVRQPARMELAGTGPANAESVDVGSTGSQPVSAGPASAARGSTELRSEQPATAEQDTTRQGATQQGATQQGTQPIAVGPASSRQDSAAVNGAVRPEPPAEPPASPLTEPPTERPADSPADQSSASGLTGREPTEAHPQAGSETRSGGMPPARSAADAPPQRAAVQAQRAVAQMQGAIAPPARESASPEGVTGEPDGGSWPSWRRLGLVMRGGAHASGPVEHPAGDLSARIAAPLASTRRLVVLGCAGGAGQTTTALMLGHSLARHRRDRCLAVDANVGPRSLAQRCRMETPETLTSLLSRVDSIRGYLALRAYTSQTGSGLEVIASDEDAALLTSFRERDFAAAATLLGQYYTVSLFDPAEPIALRILPLADQLVLVAPAGDNAIPAVEGTLEWLRRHGYGGLASDAVLVINGVTKAGVAAAAREGASAAGRCRRAVQVPSDDRLHLGTTPSGTPVFGARNSARNGVRARGPVEPEALHRATREAYFELASSLVDGFSGVADDRQEVSR